MHKLLLLFWLTLITSIASAQNIYTALQLNQEREYKTKRPRKIVEINTFFNSTGKTVDKNIKLFDDAGMLVSEERFEKSGTLTAKLTFTNDTVNRLTLSRTFERWNQFGYSRETAFYSYDSSNALIRTTDKDANGNTFSVTELLCNEKGHPIELTLLDGNGNQIGKETAIYLYETNQAVTSVISNDGKILSTDTLKISFKNAHLFPGNTDSYNLNGDLISGTTKSFNGTITLFEEEYRYDKWGNCLEQKIFNVTFKANGKRKKEPDRIFRKEYTY